MKYKSVEVKCSYCGKLFNKSVSEIKSVEKEGRKYHYCSLSCGAKSQAKKKEDKHKKDYLNNKKLCKNCKMELTWEKRKNMFCSKNCSAKHNNQKRTKFNKCCKCEKDTKNKKFCSETCASEFKHSTTVSKIECSGNFNGISKKTIRRYLIEKFGKKCEICKIDNWLGRELLLILDHIDGNSRNNSINNIRLICSNCDAQTSTYKGRNKGRGRHYRKERYKKGLSY